MESGRAGSDEHDLVFERSLRADILRCTCDATALVVTVYGPEYTLGASLIVGIAAYRVLSTQTTPLSQTLNGLDSPDVNMRASSVALVVNITLGVVLTLLFGPIGVVVATILAETLSTPSLPTWSSDRFRRWNSRRAPSAHRSLSAW